MLGDLKWKLLTAMKYARQAQPQCVLGYPRITLTRIQYTAAYDFHTLRSGSVHGTLSI